MATNSTWTVVMDDKMIINQTVKNENGYGTAYIINDDSFWSQSKFADVWAVQYVADNLDHNDTVEYRDGKPHATWNNANLGSFSDFITKWDAAHLAQLQLNWDNDNVTDEDGNITETAEQKINRLGARPTSYVS